MIEKLTHTYKTSCTSLSFLSMQMRSKCLYVFSQSHLASAALFIGGLLILCLGLCPETYANLGGGQITFNDQRITAATNAVLTYLEGSFGALVMVASGIGCILSAAFGQYRSAIGLMVVAIGSFILRSIVSTFFNDTEIQE